MRQVYLAYLVSNSNISDVVYYIYREIDFIRWQRQNWIYSFLCFYSFRPTCYYWILKRNVNIFLACLCFYRIILSLLVELRTQNVVCSWKYYQNSNIFQGNIMCVNFVSKVLLLIHLIYHLPCHWLLAPIGSCCTNPYLCFVATNREKGDCIVIVFE